MKAEHQVAQVPVRRAGQPQPGQHLIADPGPALAVEQLRARVSPPHRGIGEEVAAAKRPVQLLQDAQHVGVPVGPVCLKFRVAVDSPLPRGGYQRGADLIAAQVPCPDPPPGEVGQPPDLSQQLLPGRGSASASSSRNGRTTPYRAVRASRIAASSAASSGTSSSITATALSTSSRGATCSTAVHAAVTSSQAPPSSMAFTSAFAALASVADARSSRGIVASRSAADARRATLISLVAISTSNRSRASSTAAASR